MSAKQWLLDEAQRKVDEAEAAGRQLTKAEQEEVKEILQRARQFDVDAAWLKGDLSGLSSEEVTDLLRRKQGNRELEMMRGPVTSGPSGFRDHYDTNGNVVGTTPIYPGGKGFAGAIMSAGWSLKANPVVDVPLGAALFKASTFPSAETYSVIPASGIADEAVDRRFIYQLIPSRQVDGETSVDDFIASGRTIEGSVTRALDATTAKAALELTIAAANVEFEQVAVVTSGIPNSVLESIPAATEFFNRELRLAIAQAIDDNVYTAITSGASASAGTGGDEVARIRNAVAELRDDGFNPNLLVVDSLTGAELDLSTDAGGYIFPVGATGSSSPLFSLRVVESVAATGPPLLIDTGAIGTLFLGSVRLAADPYAGADGANFTKNLTDLRAEATAKMHVRRAGAAMTVGSS